MLATLHLLGMFIVDLFKSRRRLEAENLLLRHQLSIGCQAPWHAWPPRHLSCRERSPRSAPDDLDCFMAGRASGAVHFDLSLSSHLLGPIYLGSATAEGWPMGARWHTLPLGATSEVQRGVGAETAA